MIRFHPSWPGGLFRLFSEIMRNGKMRLCQLWKVDVRLCSTVVRLCATKWREFFQSPCSSLSSKWTPMNEIKIKTLKLYPQFVIIQNSVFKISNIFSIYIFNSLILQLTQFNFNPPCQTRLWCLISGANFKWDGFVDWPIIRFEFQWKVNTMNETPSIPSSNPLAVSRAMTKILTNFIKCTDKRLPWL